MRSMLTLDISALPRNVVAIATAQNHPRRIDHFAEGVLQQIWRGAVAISKDYDAHVSGTFFQDGPLFFNYHKCRLRYLRLCINMPVQPSCHHSTGVRKVSEQLTCSF